MQFSTEEIVRRATGSHCQVYAVIRGAEPKYVGVVPLKSLAPREVGIYIALQKRLPRGAVKVVPLAGIAASKLDIWRPKCLRAIPC